MVLVRNTISRPPTRPSELEKPGAGVAFFFKEPSSDADAHSSWVIITLPEKYRGLKQNHWKRANIQKQGKA